MTRHPVRRRARAAEHGGRFPVQSLVHRQREIVIVRVAYEIVAKTQTIPGLAEQPGLARGGQRREQIRRAASGHEREFGHRERCTQDGGRPQDVQNALREPAEAAQDREPQGRRQRRAASLHPPAHQLQRPVLIECTDEFDDEQRVAAGDCHLLQQEWAGRMAGTLPARSARSQASSLSDRRRAGPPPPPAAPDPPVRAPPPDPRLLTAPRTHPPRRVARRIPAAIQPIGHRNSLPQPTLGLPTSVTRQRPPRLWMSRGAGPHPRPCCARRSPRLRPHPPNPLREPGDNDTSLLRDSAATDGVRRQSAHNASHQHPPENEQPSAWYRRRGARASRT